MAKIIEKIKLIQKTEYLLLAVIMAISFGLFIYGIKWGLPSRWNVDQSVTTALNMLKNKSILPEDYLHPALYYYALLLFIAPYLAYQYLFYADFGSFLSAANVSWNYMALYHPALSTGIFICGRLSSVIFSVFSVLLVYKIGKVIHSSRAGLFSALFLACTLDFVNWAHVTKSISLVNLLTLLSVYYAFLFIKEKSIRRNYFLSCLFGGLSFSAKFNGIITFALIPILAVWQFRGKPGLKKERLSGIFNMMLTGAGLYFFIFLISNPGILIAAKKFFSHSGVMYSGILLPRGQQAIAEIWFVNLVALLGLLLRMFGPTFVFILACALSYAVIKYSRLIAVRIMLFFVIIIITLFAVAPRVYKSADSKFIIQAVPFLAILAGIFIDDFLGGRLLPKVKLFPKAAALAVIFTVSFFYCLSLDKIYAYNDLRYHAIKWVKSNIPPKSNIIINNQLEYSLGVEILKDYNVYVLGDEQQAKSVYSFIDGDYRTFDENDLRRIKDTGTFYFIRSCWKLRESYSCSALEKFSRGLILIKSFKRQQPWYWDPSMGGYEPARIEIYVKSPA